MKNIYFPAIAFILFVVGTAAQYVMAEQTVEYYKAGDVGVFSAIFQVPQNTDFNTTVFTARASNEKAYLIYIQPPQFVIRGQTNIMRLHYEPSPEQEKIDDQIRDIWEKTSETSDKIQQAQSNIVALKLVIKEAEKDQDKVLIEKVQIKIKQIEQEVATLLTTQANFNSQIRALEKEREKILERQVPPQTVSEPQRDNHIRFLGRFQGTGKVSLSVFGRSSDDLLAKPSLISTVELVLPTADTGNPELLKQWASVQAMSYIGRVIDSPYTSYYQYCLLQSKTKYGISDNLFYYIFQRNDFDKAPDLYSMTTGALAIQESLQLEEMTGRREIPLEHDVSISSLEGPKTKSHPFEEMLKGRTPKTFPAAALVPNDNYYCHFTSISKEIEASDMLKQWGSNLLRAITVTARDSDLPSRYTDQLCIDISALTRLFGDSVIGEIAITGGDPFLREGSDLALIIEVKVRAVFDLMMKGYIDKTLKLNHDSVISESEYEKIKIQSVKTADCRISSHSAYLGNYKVYSNSMDTLKLIIDTHSKKRKSMADNLDFKYMRTIFPATSESEDGFIYASDPFIRKLLSARWKIESQRRIICQTHLRSISNAATMFRSEMRKPPSMQSLIDANYLNSESTICPDKGKYSLDESGRAFCTVHNCLGYCTPVSSVAFDNAAKVEAEDYENFVRRYNNYWSRFFDPIGIRFKLGDRIEVETCILPLIENSIYNRLREIVGGSPVHLNSRLITDGTVASVSGKLNLESNILSGLNRMRIDTLPTLPRIEDFIGNNVSLHFYDSDVLFTFSESGLSMFGSFMGLEEQIMMGLIASSVNLPLYGVVDIKNEESARIFIRDILSVMERKYALREDEFSSPFTIESYSSGQYKGHTIDTLTLRLLIIKFRLHYTIASGRLIVSTKRYVLEKAMDSLEQPQPSDVGNVQFTVKPKAVDKLMPMLRIGWQERMREACLMNIEPVRVLIECHNATEQTLNEVSKKIEGVTLRCPCGGKYRYDVERSIVYCTVHGNKYFPSQPPQVSADDEFLSFLNRITDFSVSLRFTDEGIMTKVALDLEKKNQKSPTK